MSRDLVNTRSEKLIDEFGGPDRFFEYYEDTGELVFLPRPVTCVGDKIFNTRYAGKVAGGVDGGGYIRVSVALPSKERVMFMAHRVAFRIMEGRWPRDGMIVHHRNAQRDDNRWDNLEECSSRDNSRYAVGTRVPHYCRSKRRWVAKVTVDFLTPEDAEVMQLELNRTVSRVLSQIEEKEF